MKGISMWHTQHQKISAKSNNADFNLRSLKTYRVRRILQWAGHVRRMDYSKRLPRKFLSCWCNNERNIGGAEKQWGDVLEDALEYAGVRVGLADFGRGQIRLA